MKMKYLLGSCVLISCGFALSGCTAMQKPVVSSVAVQPSQISLDSTKMMAHLDAFQKIATSNGGNRAVGTAGGLASAQYILEQAKKAGLHAQMLPFENREKTVGQNIVIEIEGQSKDTAVIVGAHYDSVKMGPGINDNASGVAVLLALLQDYAKQKVKPKHTLYLAFWDSEEVGIAGSQTFVKSLSEKQLQGIQAYINVDMVGTKNPNIMIADGDHSSIAEMAAQFKANGLIQSDYQPILDSMSQLPKHPQDAALEQSMRQYFKTNNIQIKDDVTTLTASDTLPFLGKVPVTSLILFNEQMKGDELEFAPCYHKACDTIDSVDVNSLNLALNVIQHLLSDLNK
ncbi:M20/M25/M40 family metallo-hydrolase [Acinetobacter sp. YH12140]|uniref:M20/M25/M40 family metallo-hydrolase n=1 Tax=Acinetobacter sp. YH12140 TaxID=2601124 RepID=UPI0015D46773|nr:M20/M25/M40 family metallo-hydrolase [Acinetobacter sp. YH12140]